MCARASYGPGAGLSPWASRGMRNERLGWSISQAISSFFLILIPLQNYLGLAVCRLNCVEIDTLGLRLSFSMGCRVAWP